ncbi:MAG: cbb3-type cytochrome c oxidase subunit I [Verrucomicrobiota bacterium]|nr:cbb3-type cytochrome c oxidase subunit I [Verrucomicrobiota bacterium]
MKNRFKLLSASAPSEVHTGGASTIHLTDDKIERAEIDKSTRIPVLIYYSSAIFWLLFGTLMAIIASIKLHTPSFLGDYSFLTFGLVRSAHLNAVAYGWGATAGIGTGIWLFSRLCRAKLVNPILPIIAAVFWNIGIAVGIYGILSGDSRSIEWLEAPAYSTPLIFLSFALISIWGVLMLFKRKCAHLYVSIWYLFAGFFWFPWLYGTAQVMLIMEPVQGTVQAAVNWWYAHNALGLFFTPIGLASAYYFIPKIIGRPVHSYYLSIIGFWTLALFYSWNGMHHLIGGPIPVWMVTASIVASWMMIIPVISTAINHHMTMKGYFELLKSSPALRFVVFGAMMYTASSLQGITMAFRDLNKITHFTQYTVGHAHLGLYMFYTMMMFGSMYYIVPRLVNWEWPSSTMIKVHFWCTALGSGLMVGSLTVGGLIQGLALYDAKIPFMAIVSLMQPFLIFRSISGIMIAIGHIVFGVLFIMMILKVGSKQSGPTLLNEVENGGEKL